MSEEIKSNLELYEKALIKWTHLLEKFKSFKNPRLFYDSCRGKCSFCEVFEYCTDCEINPLICRARGYGSLYECGYTIKNKTTMGFWVVFMVIALKREIEKIKKGED